MQEMVISHVSVINDAIKLVTTGSLDVHSRFIIAFGVSGFRHFMIVIDSA